MSAIRRFGAFAPAAALFALSAIPAQAGVPEPKPAYRLVSPTNPHDVFRHVVEVNRVAEVRPERLARTMLCPTMQTPPGAVAAQPACPCATAPRG